MPKIAIFIPCYNVERSIKDVLDSFSPEVLAKIDAIVTVDNQSKDGTLAILKSIQDNTKLGEKLIIIKNRDNYGLGGSQKIAYQYFLDNGFSHFMIVHGDNQGNGDEMAKFFFEVFERRPDVDLILASRFHPKANVSGYSPLRLLGNHFFNFMTFVLSGHRMSDAGTGLMFIRTAVLKGLPFKQLANSFQFNPQLNILLYNIRGLKSEEVPLNWRDSEAGSNINSLQYCWTLLKILVRYRLNRNFLHSEAFAPQFDIIKR
jgi:glycosyltransferase involved in cell wall biosynthesis